jgi:superfamily II DNA helicase RecQ
VSSIIEEWMPQLQLEEDKIVIFVKTREQVGKLVKFLQERFRGYVIFTWLSGSQENATMVANWKLSSLGILVATSGFGTGVDIATIRLVIILGAWKWHDLGQMSGRAGRDNKRCWVFFLPMPESRAFSTVEEQEITLLLCN